MEHRAQLGRGLKLTITRLVPPRFRAACILAAVALVGPFGLHAAGLREPADPVEVRTVRVGVLRGPTGLGLAHMIEQEPDFASGVAVEYVVAASPDLLVAKILSGEVEIATLPTNLGATLAARGVEIGLVAMKMWGVLYVVGPEEVQRWDDLRGQRIFTIGRNATPDVVFRYLASESGLTVDTEYDLDFRYDQIELTQMMIARRVELAVLPEPFVTQVLMRTPGVHVVLDLQEQWRLARGEEAALAQTGLFMTHDLFGAEPAFVREFLSEFRDSLERTVANPSAAAQKAAGIGLGLPVEVAEQAIPRLNIRYADANDAQAAVGDFLSVLFEFSPESVGGSLPDDDFYMYLNRERSE